MANESSSFVCLLQKTRGGSVGHPPPRVDLKNFKRHLPTVCNQDIRIQRRWSEFNCRMVPGLYRDFFRSTNLLASSLNLRFQCVREVLPWLKPRRKELATGSRELRGLTLDEQLRFRWNKDRQKNCRGA